MSAFVNVSTGSVHLEHSIVCWSVHHVTSIADLFHSFRVWIKHLQYGTLRIVISFSYPHTLKYGTGSRSNSRSTWIQI